MRLFTLTMVATLLVPAALADDLNPPDWRGDPGSTFQHWTFDAQPEEMSAIVPDIDQNPFGDPLIIDNEANDSEWLDTFEGRQGVWNAYWDFWIDLPNDPEPRPLKEILVQFTYYYDDPTGWDNGRPIIDDVFVTAGTAEVGVVEEYELGDNWYYSQWHIRIEPNPDFESLHVIADDDYSELYFDQIVIDTICIPEPASLSLLGLAAVALLRRR